MEVIFYRDLTARKISPRVVFDFFNFNLEVLKGVQSVMEFTAKIYQITNGLGGRQLGKY